MEKEELINELKDLNQELTSQNQLKGEEIRVVIDKMEQYKRVKDTEIAKLKKQIKVMEEDIKVLLSEQERHKKVANEKIKLLSEMFR